MWNDFSVLFWIQVIQMWSIGVVELVVWNDFKDGFQFNWGRVVTPVSHKGLVYGIKESKTLFLGKTICRDVMYQIWKHVSRWM